MTEHQTKMAEGLVNSTATNEIIKEAFKEFRLLVRAFSLRGHTMILTKQGCTTIRLNLAKHLPTYVDAVAFLRQNGGRYEL